MVLSMETLVSQRAQALVHPGSSLVPTESRTGPANPATPPFSVLNSELLLKEVVTTYRTLEPANVNLFHIPALMKMGMH